MDHLASLLSALPSLREVWLLVYGLTVLSVLVMIVLENRNPIKAVGWVLVLLLLPAVGLAAYFLFGRDNRRQRLMSKHAYRRIMSHVLPSLPQRGAPSLMEESRWLPLSSLISSQTGAPLITACRLQIYTHGADKSADLLADLRRATHHIHLQYYIIADDAAGQQLADLLIEKARQGVRVRVVYDHVGSWRSSERFYARLRKAGVEVYPFLRVVFPLFTSKVNYRNHRKVVIIDGEIGYLGGMNIANRYALPADQGGWRDTHLRLEGEAVAALQASFVADWYVASQRILPAKVYTPVHSPHPSEGALRSFPMQVFQSGPIGPWRTLLHVFCHAIYNAKKSVWIETPYFLPNETLSRAIIGAALSGIDVQVILPAHSDSLAVGLASDSYIGDLLAAGVKVYRYQPSFLHSKLLLIDESLTLMGSANMDFRSLEHNFELTACIYDPAVTIEMRRRFVDDRRASRPILRKVWERRPFWVRLPESVMRLFAPLL